MAKRRTIDFDCKNAKALTDMLTDSETSEVVRIQIINELNEVSKDQNFFETMLNEDISLGFCPHCNHKDHWLIPADVLAEMGWVLHEKDPRVQQNTTVRDCPEFAESCSKKKVTV